MINYEENTVCSTYTIIFPFYFPKILLNKYIYNIHSIRKIFEKIIEKNI